MNIGLCQMFSSTYIKNKHMVFLTQFSNIVTYVDFPMLNQLCIPEMNLTWSGCVILFVYLFRPNLCPSVCNLSFLFFLGAFNIFSLSVILNNLIIIHHDVVCLLFIGVGFFELLRSATFHQIWGIFSCNTSTIFFFFLSSPFSLWALPSHIYEVL